MAYETGTSPDIRDVLQKIEFFLKSKGWGAEWLEEDSLYLTKSENYFAIYVDDSKENNIADNEHTHYPIIKLFCLSSYKPGQGIVQQEGYTRESAVTSGIYPGLLKYEFYYGETYFHVVLEIQAGLYAHFGFGVHEKAFSYKGGCYAYGTQWVMSFGSNYTYRGDAKYSSHSPPFSASSCQFTYDNNVYHASSDGKGAIPGYRYNKSSYNLMPNRTIEVSPNEMSGVSPLLPIINAVSPPPHKGTYILGKVPDMRIVKVDNLRPGELVKIGQDEWHCYPIKRRVLEEVSNDQVSSGTYGLAYRKIT